ncbi:MAG: PD40 domain-containing protein [Armatimonadetes bacterium]|nr:PD40 domain-containing protein [Armatimonadota bacterium]
MILTTLVALTLAQSSGMEVRLMRFPDIHEDRIVFTYASDLWLVGIRGGMARRLTSHPGTEYRAKFSPDGEWIAFTAQYDGDRDVYVMPAEGGQPKRLTYNAGNDFVGDWTPDGRIAFASDREEVRPGPNSLWFVSPDGGMPTKSAVHEIADMTFSEDGSTVAYNRVNSHQYNWRGYRGGVQGKVSFWNFRSKKYSEMATGREQNYFPMYVGGDVYYISDPDQGTLNLFKYEPSTNRKTKLTRFSDADIRWPSTDGKSIVFERNGHMYVFDTASGDVDEVNATVRSEDLSRRPYYKNVAQWVDSVAMSPSGKRLAITARGDLYTVPAKNGETRNLTNSQGVREEMVSWSPDGQEIAYVSDVSGDTKLYRMPQMGGEPTMVETQDGHVIAGFQYSPDSKKIGYVTEDNELYIVNLESGESTFVFKNSQGFSGAASLDWSKDGKWIAYIKTQPSLFGAVYIYDVENDEHHQITDGYYNEGAVAFDLNGKYLYIVSSRSFGFNRGAFEIGVGQLNVDRVYVIPLKADMTNPLLPEDDEEPVKEDEGEEKSDEEEEEEQAEEEEEDEDESTIDFEGLAERAIALPWPPGSYPFLVGADDGVFTLSSGTLMKFDMKARSSQNIISGATGFDFSPDRKKMAYKAGGAWAITDIKPGLKPGADKVSFADVNMTIDPVKEWRQIMRDAWRYQRDNFYDEGMLGLDWDAIGEKYIGMVDSAGDRSDVNYVMGMMIGELGTGHAYNSGGDFGQPVGNPNTGMLGVDYAVRGDAVVIEKVYRGQNYSSSRRGPLGAPGVDVKDGDLLLEIDGQKVHAGIDVHRLLVGKAGKFVRIKVAGGPSEIDAREYKVQTIANESQLRYISWVEANRKRVEELSGGRIGYVHVPNTAVGGITEFMRGYYGQSDKKAFIVDERYNGGGFIPTFFGERLTRKIVTGIQQRHAESVMYPPQAWDGPKAMLINRYAGSGGDHFPWLFRYHKIGPLIGTRTWGGLVGISGRRQFVDGGSVTSPEFALYDLETGQIIAENKGIDPDIEVDDTPDLVSQGRDPELEAAVEYLLNELKKPRKEYTKPKFLTGGGN